MVRVSMLLQSEMTGVSVLVEDTSRSNVFLFRFECHMFYVFVTYLLTFPLIMIWWPVNMYIVKVKLSL
jgi:hypothetical protein